MTDFASTCCDGTSSFSCHGRFGVPLANMDLVLVTSDLASHSPYITLYYLLGNITITRYWCPFANFGSSWKVLFRFTLDKVCAERQSACEVGAPFYSLEGP